MKESDLDAMKKEIVSTFAGMGAKIVMDPDADLSCFKRGKLLTLTELQSMPDGSVVWYTEDLFGERGHTANGAYRIKRLPATYGYDAWQFTDGSCLMFELHLEPDHYEPLDPKGTMAVTNDYGIQKVYSVRDGFK